MKSFGSGAVAASVICADKAVAGLRFAQALREIPVQADDRNAAKAAWVPPDARSGQALIMPQSHVTAKARRL
jgi:hypothetical protein